VSASSSKSLGIIGGLGPAAGLYYYARLMDEFKKRDKELRLFLAHAHMPTVVDYVRNGEKQLLAEYLATLVEALARSGATLAAITAVTPHLCIEELAGAVSIPLVNVLEAIPAGLSERGVRRVALFGTRQVIESDLFGALADFDVVRPRAEEIEFIDTTYRALAARGAGTPGERDALTKLALDLCSRERLDTIVLAGTDLSPMFEDAEPSFRAVDCSRVHIAAIVARCLAPETPEAG
jgi:aspartate racemase